jgi:hypothetical protein
MGWRGRAGVEEAGFVGEHDGLDPVAEIELLQDVGDVRLDGGAARLSYPRTGTGRIRA